VGEVIAHAGDVDPGDCWFPRAGRIRWLDCFADIDETNSYGVEYQPVIELVSPHVVGNGSSSGKDVDQPLVVVTAHNAIASPNTSEPFPPDTGSWPPPAGGQVGASTEERNWAMAAHIGSLVAAWFALGLIAPLLMLLTWIISRGRCR
jgi:hypothetical protein